MQVDPCYPMGQQGPALLACFYFEADLNGPMAILPWVGSTTQWVDPAHSHLEGVVAGGQGQA
jgi:hypothetical protein